MTLRVPLIIHIYRGKFNMKEQYAMNKHNLPQGTLIMDVLHGAAEFQDMKHAKTVVVIPIIAMTILGMNVRGIFPIWHNMNSTTIIYAITLMLRQPVSQLGAQDGAHGTLMWYRTPTA